MSTAQPRGSPLAHPPSLEGSQHSVATGSIHVLEKVPLVGVLPTAQTAGLSGRRMVDLIRRAYFSDYGYSSTPQVIIDAIKRLSPESAVELAGLPPSRLNTIIAKVIREIKSV